jgi:hypothetical protein
MKLWPLRHRSQNGALNTKNNMIDMSDDKSQENKDPSPEQIKQLKEKLLSEINALVERTFAELASSVNQPSFQHKFTFNPPVEKDKGPFKSFVNKVLEKLRSEGKLEYRIIEGKAGEVVAVEFNPYSPEAKEHVERYAAWVQKVSEKEPL